jgi:hypothetical protein
MNSGSSTEPRRAGDTGLQAWHFYLLLSMAAAIWAVAVARDTHPAALLLISGAVVASGLAAAGAYYALTGFLGVRVAASPPPARLRDAIVREKTLVLRSIKELEFDHAMRKISDQDFAEIGSRLRARAMELIEDLDQLDQAEPASDEPPVETVPVPEGQGAPAPIAADVGVFAGLTEPASAVRECAACDTTNDPDARFCKACGAKLA